MTHPSQSSPRPRPVNQAEVTGALQRSGLSLMGIQQALQGHIVSDPSDRATISRILAVFATLPPHVTAEIYDYPGGYAERFDGVDTGKGKGEEVAKSDVIAKGAARQTPSR